MSVGQRALLLLALTWLSLAFLVIYLDGRLEREPVIYFVFLWLFDAVVLISLVIRCIRFYERDSENEYISRMFGYSRLNVAQAFFYAAPFAFKLLFELLLCLQLRHKRSESSTSTSAASTSITSSTSVLLSPAVVLAPLWISLALGIACLSAEVCRATTANNGRLASAYR